MDGASSPERSRLQARERAPGEDPLAGCEAETAGKGAARRDREARALRQNLKRRKAQSRARGNADAAREGEPVAPETR